MPEFNHPGVSQNVFLGLIWAAEGLALIFLSTRLYTRIRTQRRIFWDDALAIFATSLTVVVAGLWQWQAPAMYEILEVMAGLAPPTPDFADKTLRWLKVQLIAELFFYTGLTAVKLAFLLFFKRLGHNVNRFNWFWWPVVIFVVAIYAVCLGTVEYRCLLPSIEDVTGYCSSPELGNFTAITLKFNCAMDVFSDFLIILIPVWLLWNVRIAFAKKLAFVGLFSLSIVTMAIATARAADLAATTWDNGVIDPSYLWMWTAIEPCIAIAVSCLSAFPQLFAASVNASKPVYKPTDSYLRLMSRIRSKRNQNQRREPTTYDISNISQVDYIRAPETSSTEQLQPALVPGSHQPMTVCYKTSHRGNSDEMQGQIKRELGYQVTEQSAWR
ncbi:uncharacterized protein B0H64DRAFT_403529 [Chaetomium fimeti]|jgi:hypothetical protein|uniref:Rhodopsin domain-containing protein n=1 Tax=Chaetomium fimeti TaxID=1854472 RepID=A0AAE0HAU4_9PEZI|nr:hypothetical protein B0H64DRAFT_403529 [Chaetomium fimeti]